MINNFVIFGFKAFGNHTSVIIKVEDSIPYNVCGCIDILDNETTATIAGLNLRLLNVDK